MNNFDSIKGVFRTVSGVGPKLAEKISYYLLRMPEYDFNNFISNIKKARMRFKICGLCGIFYTDRCIYCSADRDTKICIIEKESVIEKIEQSGYNGRYFLVTIDEGSFKENIDRVDIEKLIKRIVNEKIHEVIVALSITPEAKVLADYIVESIKKLGVKISTLATGIPFGAEIEYVDEGTIKEAFINRRQIGL